MPVQKRQINKATGKGLIRAATGKAVFAADGTPCGCTLPPVHCCACNPQTGAAGGLLVTISGLGPCTAVGTCGGITPNLCVPNTSTWYKFTSFSMNTTFCLPFIKETCVPGSFNICQWGANFSGVCTILLYDCDPSSGCPSGTHCTCTHVTIIAEKRNISGSGTQYWYIVAYPTEAFDGTCTGSIDSNVSLIQNDNGATTRHDLDDCTYTATIDNSAIVCESIYPGESQAIICTGGSVTIVPGGC